MKKLPKFSNTAWPYLIGGLVILIISQFGKTKEEKILQKLNNMPYGGTMDTKLYTWLTREEGLKFNHYKDGKGSSIGIGHQIQKGEEYLFSGPISLGKVMELYNSDVNKAKKDINRDVKINLTEAMMIALISFRFNIGPTQWDLSTIRKLLKDGNVTAAALEFPKWRLTTIDGKKVVSPTLVLRRAREQKLFTLGLGI